LLHVCLHGDPTTTNLQSWVRALARQPEVKVTVLSLGTGMTRIEEVPVVDLPLPSSVGPVRFGLALPLVRRAVRRIRPDLLLGYRIPSYGVLAFLSGHRPVGLVAQSETELWPPALALKQFLLTRIVPRADLIQVWAPTMQPSLREVGAREEQFLCLPRGIDVKQFEPGRDLAAAVASVPGPERPIRLIVTRTLHEDYNHWHILEAMAALARDGVGTELEVVGDGPLRAEIEALAARLVPGRVRFLGRVAHDALPERLRAADLYVSTPITEGLSASLVEAMGCGLFPIVTDHAGNRWLVRDGENGFLVPVGDVPALARAIRRAWESRELRARAVRDNRAFVEREMDVERNMAAMVARYREVVERARVQASRRAA